MENDLIRRSDLLAKKCLIRGHLDQRSQCPSKVKAVPVDVIEREPAVDAVPVRHGRWILIETDEEQLFFCSECENKEYWESDFCPSCGAKMDGGDKNDE